MKVGLADEHDLNQLRLLGFEIRQHPDFLERSPPQVLRLVDDEQREPAGSPLIDEEARQIAQQVRLAPAGRRLEAEVEHDGFDQLARIEHRAHQPRDRRPPVDAPQRGLQQRRLARSDLAGDDDEAGVSFDAVAQVAQRLGVHPARIEVVGIRAQRERPLAQVVEAFIHDGRASRLVRRRRARAARVRAARRSRSTPAIAGSTSAQARQ